MCNVATCSHKTSSYFLKTETDYLETIRALNTFLDHRYTDKALSVSQRLTNTTFKKVEAAKGSETKKNLDQ